jgi:hypothetical protein
LPLAWKLAELAVVGAVSLLLAGCGASSAPKQPVANKTDAHDHAHDHAHHGPHHGHLMEIGEEEYHAEWVHDETGKVTFYILDAEAKKEVPIDASEIRIEVKLGDQAPVTYTLPAVQPQDGKSAVFELTNKELLGVLETLKSPGVVATLHVTIAGKTFAQRIVEHEHAH